MKPPRGKHNGLSVRRSEKVEENLLDFDFAYGELGNCLYTTQFELEQKTGTKKKKKQEFCLIFCGTAVASCKDFFPKEGFLHLFSIP